MRIRLASLTWSISDTRIVVLIVQVPGSGRVRALALQ